MSEPKKHPVGYFQQPGSAIRIVSRKIGVRHMLTPETIAEAKLRIAAGEDIDAVALDLAIDALLLEELAK